MAKTLKKPTSLIESYHSLDIESSLDSVVATKTKPKSYSLPIEIHDWLVSESAKRTVKEGRRVSASQLLTEIVVQYKERI